MAYSVTSGEFAETIGFQDPTGILLMGALQLPEQSIGSAGATFCYFGAQPVKGVPAIDTMKSVKRY